MYAFVVSMSFFKVVWYKLVKIIRNIYLNINSCVLPSIYLFLACFLLRRSTTKDSWVVYLTNIWQKCCLARSDCLCNFIKIDLTKPWHRIMWILEGKLHSLTFFSRLISTQKQLELMKPVGWEIYALFSSA